MKKGLGIKTYLKSLFRLIKSNFSRFITISLIVMLGIGFLVGLFSVAPDLMITESNRLIDNKVSEVYLRSENGFLEEDITSLKEVLKGSEYDTSNIRGTFEIDQMISAQGSSKLARLIYEKRHENQDIYDFVSGKTYPDEGEVVVEVSGNYITSMAIGDTITISGKNYKVSGIVSNPWYLMKERYNATGQTSGALEMIVYLPYSALAEETKMLMDYTNIYLYYPMEGNLFQNGNSSKIDDIVDYIENSDFAKLHEDNFNNNVASLKSEIEDIREENLATIENNRINAYVNALKEALKMYNFTATDEEIKNAYLNDTLDELLAGVLPPFITSDMLISNIEKDEEFKAGLTKLEEAEATLNAEIDENLASLDESISELGNKLYYLPFTMSEGFGMFDNYVDKVQTVANIFPIFFIVITSLVTLTSLRRLIFEERAVIGTMRGIGYSKFMVSARYLVYGILAAALGSLLGIALGIALIPLVIYEAYTTTCFLPPLVYNYNTLIITIAVLGMILLVVLAILITLSQSLRESPARLMTPKAPKPGKRVFLEYITFIWKRLSFKYKSTVRNMIRYKTNLITMLIGVGGCMALVLVAFGINDSINAISNREFNNIINYNAIAYADGPITKLNDDKLISSLDIRIETVNYDDYSTKVIISDENINDYINFYNDKQKEYSFTSNDVVVSLQLANELDYDIGDTINYHGNEYVITNIMENYVDNYLIIGSDNFENYTKNAYLLKTGNLDDLAERELQDRLVRNYEISSVTFLSSMKSSYQTLIDNMSLIVVVVIVFAALLAFIVIFNLMNININERIRELATLRVLGYSTIECHGYIARETFILTIIGMGLGIGLGFLLHKFIAGVIDTTSIMGGRYITWQSYIFSILITLGFAIIVDLCFIPYYKKIDMVSSLKALE